MAFTPDGIAPPGIPLLGCSPPHHYEVQNGLWGGLIGGTEGARAPCTLYGATELNKIGRSKAQQTTPYQCSHSFITSIYIAPLQVGLLRGAPNPNTTK